MCFWCPGKGRPGTDPTAPWYSSTSSVTSCRTSLRWSRKTTVSLCRKLRCRRQEKNRKSNFDLFDLRLFPADVSTVSVDDASFGVMKTTSRKLRQELSCTTW